MATNRLIVDSNGRQFSCDSMDRFGDDMTELIVSYLSVRDKTKLEGVTKQWQRLINNQIISLHIYRKDRRLNRNPLNCALISIDTEDDCNRVKICLKKCPNIYRIGIDGVRHMPTLIEVMADNCHRLQSLALINCYIPLKEMTLLGRQLGHNLKKVGFGEVPRTTAEKAEETLLELCPNVETLVCEHFLAFSDQRSDFLPNLKSLNTTIDANNVSLLDDFGLKYGKQLKVLSLMADNSDENVLSSQQIIQVLRCIPIFEEIIELELDFWDKEDKEINIERELTEIGVKCRKLKKLLIDIHCNDIEGNVWKGFANFSELNELKVSFWAQTPNTDQPIKEMGLKTNLKRLNVQYINEKMFEDIDKCVPNLQSIDILIAEQLPDSLLKSLSALKHLKVLNWEQYTEDEAIVTDSGSQLLDNYPELKKIKFWRASREKFTNKTIENIIAFAKRRPKQVIEFELKTPTDNDFDIKQFDSIPANLKISIP